MARRKTTEVLITGDKVDPRERVGVTTTDAGPPQVQKPVGAFPEDNLSRRPRKKPKIIDVLDGEAPKMNPGDALAELERELGMVPTAAPGEALTDSLSVPLRETNEKDTNWQEIQRAKKSVHDLPPQVDPVPKPITADDVELSQPVVPKPQADIAPPVTPTPKKQADIAPPPAPSTKKPSAAPLSPAPVVPSKATPVPSQNGKKVKATSLKTQSNAIAQTVVSSILDRIKAEAKKNGGQLSLANIDSLQAEFGAQTRALSLAFEQSFEAYVLARERAAWDNKRDFPFDRLIVKKFSHLFGDNSAGFDRVSRRMLPGFFMAMGMMLGPDVVDEFQEKCRVIVERIRSTEADEFDWSDVYDADKNGIIILDALVPIARHFEDFEMRREWFVNLINGHLSPPSSDEKDDARWEMTIRGFNLFLNALLADLRVLLNDPKEKPRITKRYGASDVNIVLRTLKKVEPS